MGKKSLQNIRMVTHCAVCGYGTKQRIRIKHEFLALMRCVDARKGIKSNFTDEISDSWGGGMLHPLHPLLATPQYVKY